jgi:hypothetical protein
MGVILDEGGQVITVGGVPLNDEGGGAASVDYQFTVTSGQTATIRTTAIANRAAMIAKSKVEGDTWVTCLGEYMPDVIERPRFPHTVHVTGRPVSRLEPTSARRSRRSPRTLGFPNLTSPP